jgi:hypothetical protein
MKIVNLTEFLKLPPNTVFSKFEPDIFSELQIKMESLDYNDFFSTMDFANSIDCAGSSERWDKLTDAVANGTPFPMEFESIGRDGLFEDKQLFAVWDENDVMRLIERLNRCIKIKDSGHGNNP